MLFSMCDFFGIVCNVWKQIVVSKANMVNKISVIPGVPYNRVFM